MRVGTSRNEDFKEVGSEEHVLKHEDNYPEECVSDDLRVHSQSWILEHAKVPPFALDVPTCWEPGKQQGCRQRPAFTARSTWRRQTNTGL